MVKKRGWLLLLILLVIGYVSAWSVTISNPTDDKYLYQGQPTTFQFTTSADAPNTMNCRLWTNFSGSWHSNKTLLNAAKNTAYKMFNLSANALATRAYIWNVNCTNTGNGADTQRGATNFTFTTINQVHLNISINEYVNQTAIFDRDVSLTEEVTQFNVTGYVNISNPNAETVYDIWVSLRNTDQLATNLYWSGGRNGSQLNSDIGGFTEYGAISTSKVPIRDLDNDLLTDYVNINSTYIFFNISGQHNNLIKIRIQNTTGKNVSLANAGTVPVPLNINSVIARGGITYGYVNVSGTTNQDDTIIAANTFKVTEYPQRNLIFLHIPELRANDFSVFKYYLKNSTFVTAPLDVNVNYTHPVGEKIIAGENIHVNMSAENVGQIGYDMIIINITIRCQNVTWAGNNFSFEFKNLSTTGDWANVLNISNKTWYWQANGGTLAQHEKVSIAYVVNAPYSVPTTATYNVTISNLEYRLNYALSNITIHEVNASAYGKWNFTKITYKTVSGQDHNVTWRIIPSIFTTARIDYDLRSVTLWVSRNLDPNNESGLSESYTGADVSVFNYTNLWTGSEWLFNYTDGSSASYPPPIVWMKPQYFILNRYNQIINQSYGKSKHDTYISSIYVINGYWLEVTKNVTSWYDGTYKIDIWVHNKGNGWTPNNTIVTVYDFIQDDFEDGGFVPTSSFSEAVTGGSFNGTAYKWDLPQRGGVLNSSLGPNNPNSNIDEWNATYYVNGTGDFKASALYIIGLDPKQVDGASASPLISVVSMVSRISTEFVYGGVVVILVILNIINLVMTSRINKRL